MNYIEAIKEWEPDRTRSVFLAGGISNCTDWQPEMTKLLQDTELTVLNPRRKYFPDHDDAAREQIKWEFRHLKKTTATLFWFPHETLCPITLFELGNCLGKEKPLFVGCHPEYQRRRDLEIQIKLYDPYIKIVYSLEDLSLKVKKWLGMPRVFNLGEAQNWLINNSGGSFVCIDGTKVKQKREQICNTYHEAEKFYLKG